MLKFVIPGTIRSKKNSKRIIRAGKFPKLLPSKAYVRWEESFQQELFVQTMKKRVKATDKPVEVSATFYFKGPEPDLSGCMESLGDACEGILWLDDKQIVSWDGSRKERDRKNPRVEFSFKAVG